MFLWIDCHLADIMSLVLWLLLQCMITRTTVALSFRFCCRLDASPELTALCRVAWRRSASLVYSNKSWNTTVLILWLGLLQRKLSYSYITISQHCTGCTVDCWTVSFLSLGLLVWSCTDRNGQYIRLNAPPHTHTDLDWFLSLAEVLRLSRNKRAFGWCPPLPQRPPKSCLLSPGIPHTHTHSHVRAHTHTQSSYYKSLMDTFGGATGLLIEPHHISSAVRFTLPPALPPPPLPHC